MADIPINKVVSAREEEIGELEEAKKELETWKTKAEKADDVKARLILDKLKADEAKDKARKECVACAHKEKDCDFTQSMEAVQEEILNLGNRRQSLLDKLKSFQTELEAKRAESTELKLKFKIYAQIPDTEVNYRTLYEEQMGDGSQPISGRYLISQRASVHLQGGQALITFEEEKVASQILKIPKCSVSCEHSSVDVKPRGITMDPAVKFEVILDVSRKEVKVHNIPTSMPEDRMKDQLELSFCRPSRGGGEVERVTYDKNTGSGQITFLHPGVADGLALRGWYRLDLDSEVDVQVRPVYSYQLLRFQTFCGSPKRTVLLEDIEDKEEEEEDLQDHLEIHFQKPSNYGGEIQSIRYLSGGKALQAFFCEDPL
ncbi:hypothetical protein CgunFtcFv8_025155 [Champsocephalus gunnari]|uniref:NID domain-containing protein n=1 Tax=Champsocephalus gunnari TaxID=52237 RepID=A0AAN8DK42_CHAGU|nr:hypothetical protein CgunFtcFv8_025155 [Champsocephalus gunnari]